MGSFISRRKRTVKVKARNISVQATECGIRESSVTSKQSTEVKASPQIQKTTNMDLSIGDGHTAHSPENIRRQTTAEEEYTSSENRKRKFGLPKTKIRPRSGKSPGSRDFSTQYDFTPYQVQQQTAENTNAERKSQPFQTDIVKFEEVAESHDNSRQENEKTLDGITDGAAQPCGKTSVAENAVAPRHNEGDNVKSTTLGVPTSPQIKRAPGFVRRSRAEQAGREGESDSGSKPISPLQTENAEFIGDTKLTSNSSRPKSVSPHSELKLKLESLEDVSQENVPGQVEVTAVTGVVVSYQAASPPAGYQGDQNQEAKTWIDKPDLSRETEGKATGKPDSAPVVSSELIGQDSLHESEIQKVSKGNNTESIPRHKDVYDDGKAADVDGSQDEGINEDTLDWNVDDRVRSPSDPEKEEDTDSCSTQEVIPESSDVDNNESQEDVMVQAYSSDVPEDDQKLVEDTLDTNVDDRVHSPSDPRSDDDLQSSEEDDTIDLLMNCAVDGEAVWPGQRHNSLTTLKDGDAAEGMIYSPPLKSPHKEMAADTCNEELEDKTTSGHVCDPPEPDADLTVKTLLLGTSGTENELLKSSDKNDTNESCQTSSPNSAAQEDRSLLKVEITEDVPVTDSQEITQPQRSEDFEPNKVTADIQESSESATQSPKYENHSGKLLMNLGDRTLSLGVDDSSKPVLEMQEAEAMTLFLTKGTLPCESNEDVKRGAGDGRNVDVPGADVSDENQVADEKAGIDAMLDTRSKSSCQLEQIQAVQSEMESVHNIVPLNTELPHNQESIHNIVPHDTQLPQNQQSTENDSSAACAPANHQPQGEPHVMADAGQEADSSTVCGHNTLSHHVIHGAAAASFEEERMADNLLLPERPTSPGAAASEGEWQIVPLHRVFAHTNLGGLAASASPTHSHIHTDGLQETDSDTHQTVDGLGNDSSIFIEVQTAETTNILAPSLPEESLAQLDQTAQAPDSPSPGHPEQDELCSGYGYVPNAYDAAEGNTQDETTNILAPSLPEESVVQQDQTAQASDSLTQGHPEQDELCSGYGDVPNTDDTTEGKTNNETTDSLAPSLLDESLAQQDKTIQPPGSLIHGHPEQNQLCSKFGDVPKTDDPAKYKIQDETSENLEYSVHEANEKGGTEDAQRIVAAVQLQGNGVDTAPEKEQITSDQLTEASALKVHPDAGSDLQDVKAEQE